MIISIIQRWVFSSAVHFHNGPFLVFFCCRCYVKLLDYWRAEKNFSTSGGPLRPEARGICHICHTVNPALSAGDPTRQNSVVASGRVGGVECVAGAPFAAISGHDVIAMRWWRRGQTASPFPWRRAADDGPPMSTWCATAYVSTCDSTAFHACARHKSTTVRRLPDVYLITRGKVLSWKYRSPRKRNSRPSSTPTILNAHSPQHVLYNKNLSQPFCR